MTIERNFVIEHFKNTRIVSENLCRNLLVEDYVIQAMEDVSPPKWHLAHTTWFFEIFILNKYLSHRDSSQLFQYIFNSYYQGIGTPYPRNKRGLLARPSVETIFEYRKTIDQQLIHFIENCSAEIFEQIQPLVCLGIHHEQQHQELLLMDIKYNFSIDPSYPAYAKKVIKENFSENQNAMHFFTMDEGIVSIGYEERDFCYDNELPRHKKLIQSFSIADRLITNFEYLEFINDGAYSNPQFWLADAWDWLKLNQIKAPLYWQLKEKQWMCFSLKGFEELALTEPVSHVSYYEADAFARWKACRLPTEDEWECAAQQLKWRCSNDNFKDNELIQFNPISKNSVDSNFGQLWEWTSSAYQPYPGYQPLVGAVGEYNGKFMNNQRVLRGASFVTPRSHVRISYRNFYGPEKRWQFCGIRLAKNN